MSISSPPHTHSLSQKKKKEKRNHSSQWPRVVPKSSLAYDVHFLIGVQNRSLGMNFVAFSSNSETLIPTFESPTFHPLRNSLYQQSRFLYFFSVHRSLGIKRTLLISTVLVPFTPSWYNNFKNFMNFLYIVSLFL